MVGREGLAPSVFLMWQIYSLLSSLLDHLPEIYGRLEKPIPSLPGRMDPHGTTASTTRARREGA